MRKRQPEKKTDKVGGINLSPHDVVGEYITSKEQKKYYVKPPEWDSPGNTIQLLYFEFKQQHEIMIMLQKEMLENNYRLNLSNGKRVQGMLKIQELLRKRFVDVNSFVRDCSDKKRAAKSIVAIQSEWHDIYKKSIAEHKVSIAEMEQFKEALKDTVYDYSPYQQVIADVVKRVPIYSSIKDCIDRCDALMLGQIDIRRVGSLKQQQIEEMRQQFIKLTNEAMLTVLGLKNDLSKLERSYNQARSNCLRWEKNLSRAKGVYAQNDVNKQWGYDALKNLVALFQKRKGERVDLAVVPCKSADFIKREVELLTELIKEYYADGQVSTKVTQETTIC